MHASVTDQFLTIPFSSFFIFVDETKRTHFLMVIDLDRFETSNYYSNALRIFKPWIASRVDREDSSSYFCLESNFDVRFTLLSWFRKRKKVEMSHL